MTKYVKDWFLRADDDLLLIKTMLKENSFSPNPLCFHAQQAAEKYLKGFLAHNDLHVRKIHDLEVLMEDCIKIDESFGKLRGAIKSLNRFYIESRYPDDYIQFSPDDAKQANKAAKEIKKFILDKIK